MPGNIDFKIEGLRQAEKILQELGGPIARRVGSNALRSGARVIVKEAKRRVPVDTGNLRDAITQKTISRPRNPDARLVFVGISSERVPDRKRATNVDNPAKRAHLVEFGAPGRNVQPQPFLRPALDSQVRNASVKIATALGRGIEREVRKQLGIGGRR